MPLGIGKQLKMKPRPAGAKHCIRVLDRTGDTVLAEWTTGTTKEDEVERELAQQIFDQKVAEGWLVFKAKPGTVPEGPHRTFDPSAEEYLVQRPFQGG